MVVPTTFNLAHRARRRDACRVAAVVAAAALLIAQGAALAAGACRAQSPATAAPVVELYTSEGCSSCPPADRWLSHLKSDPEVVALAFHVDYWDRLGWKDRFASPAFTQRQAEQQRPSGARFSYTPQVIVNGVDRPDWPGASITRTGGMPAVVDVRAVRDGRRFVATVTAGHGAPAHLAAYWAVTEDGHVSDVKAGENQGTRLTHEDVVREYHPVPVWATREASTMPLQFEVTSEADPAHPREVNLVIVNAESGRPVQALKIGC